MANRNALHGGCDLSLQLSKQSNSRHYFRSVATQSVDADDNDGVPVAGVVQQRGQAGPLLLRRGI
jgi:hypothetical protein